MPIYNYETLIGEVIRDRQIEFGYVSTPVFVIDATAQTAPASQCFYRIKPYGEDAVITSVLDLNGDAITQLAGATIVAGSTFLGRFSAIQFSNPSAGKFVKLDVMNINN